MPPAAASVDESTNACSLYQCGRSPSTSTRCSFSRIACQMRPGDDSTAQRTMKKTTREEAEREPVEVLRVDDADERLRQLRVVGAEALLAVRPVVRILEREHRARLRERERHHRERDAADAQADDSRARSRARTPTPIVKRIDGPEAPVPVGDRDVREVDAERDVQRVPERQQAGEPELDVVRQRERRRTGGRTQSSASVPGESIGWSKSFGIETSELRHERERAEDRRAARPSRRRARRFLMRALRRRAGDSARPREQHDAEQQHDDHVADARRRVVVRVLLRRARR